MITDEHGKELICSDGPQGNIGCPVDDHEVEWFMTMIRKTARTLDEKQLLVIETELRAYGKTLGR